MDKNIISVQRKKSLALMKIYYMMFVKPKGVTEATVLIQSGIQSGLFSQDDVRGAFANPPFIFSGHSASFNDSWDLTNMWTNWGALTCFVCRVPTIDLGAEWCGACGYFYCPTHKNCAVHSTRCNKPSFSGKLNNTLSISALINPRIDEFCGCSVAGCEKVITFTQTRTRSCGDICMLLFETRFS